MIGYNINKAKNDINKLQHQNSIDFQEIKKIYQIIDEVNNKIELKTNIDKCIVDKLNSDYQELVKVITDEEIALKLSNDINTVNSRVDNLISNVGTPSLEKDLELIDMRTNSTGQTYTTTGELIRVIDKTLKEIYTNVTTEIDTSETEFPISMTNNGFWNQSKLKVDTGNWPNFFYSEKIPVVEGETYKIVNFIGVDNLHPLMLALDKGTSSPYSLIYPSADKISGTVEFPEIIISIPSGVDTMVLNSKNYDSSVMKVYKLGRSIKYLNSFVDENTNKIKTLEDDNVTNISKISSNEFENVNIENKLSKLNDLLTVNFKPFTNTYFNISIDDSNSKLYDFYDLFTTNNNIPISTACIVSKLDKNTYSSISNKTITIRELNHLIEGSGGEVLAHYSGSLNDNSTNEEWEAITRDVKKALVEAGYNIRGIIRADSTAKGSIKGEYYCQKYFEFSDTLGKSKQFKLVDRKMLINLKTLDDAYTYIDTCCANKGFYGICIHGLRNDEPLATLDNLQQIINYMKSKNVIFTTFKDVYDNLCENKLQKLLNLL